MNADQVFAVLDYETYSEAPLKKVGGWEYSVHPSTEILCVAWRIGTRETLRTAKTEYWAPGHSSIGESARLYRAFLNPRVMLVAQNALFEQVITRNVFAKKNATLLPAIPPSRWVCTAALAAMLALPRKLEGSAAALKLPIQKDMDGNRLIMKWCKPRKTTKTNPKTRHDDPAELKRIIEYCMTDVDATVELFLRCPPLSPTERKVWVLDQEINMRGFLVDRPLVNTTLRMIEEEMAVLNAETTDLTFGGLDSVNQRTAVIEWLNKQGVFLPDLRKKTVEDAIKENLVEGDAKRMLELRQSVSKTSTAKYEAFEMRSRYDGRLRDILLYAAASTGRWGGMGVQPQNFPRGTIRDTIQASKIVAEGDLEMVRLIYGDPMSVFSSCIRNMIVAPDGHTLDIADYNAIETRVLFWMADDAKGVQAFVDGRDLYCDQAADVFGVPSEEIEEKYKAGDATATFQRFIGKVLVLGCGYGLGGNKFSETCKMQNQDVSEDFAKSAVAAYRTTHAPVVKSWDNVGRAAIAAVQNPGRRYAINHTAWFVKNGFLFCELPSGRRLSYPEPEIVYKLTPWGDKRPTLTHMGVNGMTRKWERQSTYGGKLVENVVQAIARDIMAWAMLRIDAVGPWKIVLSVHDELIAERKIDANETVDDFIRLMAELPPWAVGCPIKVAGFTSPVYKK